MTKITHTYDPELHVWQVVGAYDWSIELPANGVVSRKDYNAYMRYRNGQ